MALQYSPKIITDSLVMCLDASQNKSYPTDLPVKNGLLVWLDAADDSTFSYSSGTEVSQWRDKSGNNFHANQATTAIQPSRNTVVNSRKSVNFTSTNGDFIRIPNGVVFSKYFTAVVVVKPGTQSAEYAVILDQDHSTTGYQGWVIQRNASTSFWQTWVANSSANNWTNANQIAYVDNTSQIVTLRKTSSTLALYSNGTSSGDVSINDYNLPQAGLYGLNIGYWSAGGGRYYNGDICEILVYNRDLTTTELKQVHTYLGQKWGISNTDRSIVDLSNNNNHGLLGGVAGSQVVADMPLFDVYNKGALKLDGSTDYIAVENATSLNPTTVTVSIWVKRNGYQSSIASYLRRNYNDAYGILGDIAADNVRFKIYNGTTYPESPNATLSLNEWTNIVGTYDLANIKIYKNGVFVGQTAHTSAISYASANTTLTIGRDDPVAGRYMNANYGSVLIYSRALSAVEVAQNYEAQKSKFANTIVQQGLVLNLDAGNPYSYAGAGAVWYDVSGNSFNATLINSPTYTSDNGGVLNWASANSQYATVPMSSTLRVANITQEAWVYLSGTADQVFIGSQYGTSSNNSFALWLQSGTFYFGVNTGGTFYTAASSASSTSTWYHLIHTYNGTTQYLYINGVLVTTNNSAASGNISYDTSNTLLAIGADFNGTGYNVGPSVYTNGKMPVVRIYNIALSAAQVLQNYNATKGKFGR
jgi:hypothetical protein